MAMTRAEAGGWSVAFAAHVLLLVVLSVNWMGDAPARFDNPPMEVDLIAEVAPTSTAPELSPTPPAPRLGEETETLPEPAPPEPLPTPPEPAIAARPEPKVAPRPEPVVRKAVEAPRPTPKAAPKPPTRPAPKAAPKSTPAPAAKATPRPAAKSAAPAAKSTAAPRPTGRLDGIADSVSATPSKAPAAKGAPAAATAAEVRRSIDVSIKAAVRTPWNRCSVTGLDIGELKTEVRFRLTRTGALAGFTSVTTTGETESNRFQVQRHQECAKRAIELAAPFDLPPDSYSVWQNYTLDFIKR